MTIALDVKMRGNLEAVNRLKVRMLFPVEFIHETENEPGSITLPQALAVGLSFGRGDKWMVGTDFVLLDYTQFSDGKSEIRDATKGWKLSLGTEFTPDVTAMTSYLKRITYRTGVSYDKYPYLINGMPLMDFGINFGLSLPTSRSSLDFAVKIGKRGNLQDNTIEENYFKITLVQLLTTNGLSEEDLNK